MPGMRRIPEEISYGSDGLTELQPECLMHKQVVFLDKHLGDGGRGDKGQGRQVVRVSEVPHTLASTSAQVENNSLWHRSKVTAWWAEPKRVQDSAELLVHSDSA